VSTPGGAAKRDGKSKAAVLAAMGIQAVAKARAGAGTARGAAWAGFSCTVLDDFSQAWTACAAGLEITKRSATPVTARAIGKYSRMDMMDPVGQVEMIPSCIHLQK
jgi:hypothetical protein